MVAAAVRKLLSACHICTEHCGCPCKLSRPALLWPTCDDYSTQPDALFVIIPALTLPRWAAVSYISMFVIGTVAAMGGYTAVIGDCFATLGGELDSELP